MGKIRLALLAVIVGAVAIIIAWNAGSAERETKAALSARLHRETSLTVDPQYRRGVLCGHYRTNDQKSGRFVFVSHYSAESTEVQGLHLASDSGFNELSNNLCR